MNIGIYFFFLILILSKSSLEILYNSGDNWAVLACGSTGYINYRHQADIFHVYHTLLKNGFSKDHIILFAYDDIAYNEKNPFPGEIYNRPDGPNVYSGVSIDYSSYMVTPENYLSVLKGDTKNNLLKKVLNSNKDDNIFLYFSDHGINGAMVFPNNQFLYADELEEAFTYMQKKGMYKNIIYYMESCYSGSIFNEINKELNIYSITAASPKEQSYATYCFPDDYVKGREMHTCLSNEFTSNWLDDIENKNFDSLHLINYSSREQFQLIKNKTKNSHVNEYGNLNVGELPITLFQASNDSNNYEDEQEEIIEDKEKEKEKGNMDGFDYDEIMRRIKELEEEEENYNEDEYDEIISNDINDNKYKYNFKEKIKYDNDFINYIISRNKQMKKQIEKPFKKNNLRMNSKKKTKKSLNNIPSKNVKLYYLEVETTKNPVKNKEFQKEMEETEKSKNLFQLLKYKLHISEKKENQNNKIDFKCLRFSIDLFKEKCLINERDLGFISSFSDICTKKDVCLDDIKNAIIDVCKSREIKL